ncbi:DUF6552 family protein [Sulfitobacter pacificus]|uniref:Ubiquinone biosynthesis methyltransferase UbiE n=1 Tax=Sulfitobacter pacificus TaxID=1499314 RepID=A0ABQ5VCN4_9RHOB|nr:DUF6552 family protein [Sulfitobacter pacificus]GLQ25248.1 hypothetical protein GCM10007927_00510 [Sulfitobacter pacificus]
MQPSFENPTLSSRLWQRRALNREKLVFLLKWLASIIQIMGYTATAFGMTPLNIYLFLVGLVGWFTVGLLWNDRAIMLIHIVALGAMLAGLISA